MDFHKVIKNYSSIFWDFDGVIKESVEIKSKAFKKLFSGYDPEIISRIEKHHLSHGGMSRYEKFPLYLKWANEIINDEKIDSLDKKFRSIVVNDVINSNWVPGVDLFLNKNKYRQDFYLISATPQNEIEEILNRLSISVIFKKIIGSPISKINAVSSIIKDNALKASDCVMIGDAISDYEAAQENRISFVLRRHNYNNEAFEKYTGYFVNDFIEKNRMAK